MDDEMKHNKKPSPYCKLMIQKFAAAPGVKNSKDVDWKTFSEAMSNADPHFCEMEFNWFKETGSVLTVLTPKDTLIPKTSATCDTVLPASSNILPSTKISKENPLQVQHPKSSQHVSVGSSKVTDVLTPQSIESIQLPGDVIHLPIEELDRSEPLTSEHFEKGHHTPETAKQRLADKKVSVVVRDSGRNVEKTFHCPLILLTNYMPYFKERLKRITVDGDVHISLHCDVIVFEKILFYISRVIFEDEKSFKIDPKYAVHLLVSAEFLQMSTLVEKCVDYCHRHLSLIIQSNGPLAALKEPLMSRLANLFNHREVEAIEDPQGKIKEKLYKNLLQRLLKPDVKIPGQPGVEKLFKCYLCDQVFPTKLQELYICKNRKAAVGSQGQLAFYHKRDPTWDYDQYLDELYISLLSWRKVYWRVWGLVSCLYCIVCAKSFCCANYTKCSFHKDPIMLPEGEPISLQAYGTFPCCGQKAFQYDPIDPLHLSYGCCFRNHSVSSFDRHDDTFQDMITYFDLICAPQDLNEVDYYFAQNGLERIVPCFSEKILTRWIFDPPGHSSADKKKISKATMQASSALPTAGDMTSDNISGSDVFVSVLSNLVKQGRPLNIKHTWQPRASHWHNQDAVRDHDEAMLQRLMLELQKLQP